MAHNVSLLSYHNIHSQCVELTKITFSTFLCFHHSDHTPFSIIKNNANNHCKSHSDIQYNTEPFTSTALLNSIMKPSAVHILSATHRSNTQNFETKVENWYNIEELQRKQSRNNALHSRNIWTLTLTQTPMSPITIIGRSMEQHWTATWLFHLPLSKPNGMKTITII